MMRGIHQNFDQQQAPAFFARGPSPLARLTFFTALSLALMATDSRLQYLANVRENLMTLLHPLQVIANAPLQLYQNTDEYFSTHHYLLAENSRLKQQALMQGIALQRLNLLNLENANLRSMLDAKQSLTETSTLAEIIHVGRDAFTKKIIVNRGKNHHVVTGAAAVDAKGVVGQVTRTYPSSSEVTLITDKSLAIPVQIERNGLRAIAFGHGRDNTLDLPYLPANVDIKRGDKLVTSGIDGVYPAGLAVATVIEMRTTQDSPFAHIVCAPTAGVENDKQILLVSIPKVELETAIEALNSEKVTPASAARPAAPNNSVPVNPDAQTAQTKKPAQPPPAENPIQKPLANVESRPHAQQ
ncbi:MAG TPA: rod shape-determining protein MreC [Methylotenera sp.]